MTDAVEQLPLLEAALDAASLAYKKQSQIVANLRAGNNNRNRTDQLQKEETNLRDCKRQVDAAKRALQAAAPETNSDTQAKNVAAAVEGLLRRRFFIAPSFEIYGGVKGLYDYGPPGCAVKNNLLAVWRQHFIVEEGMLELEATCLTPAPVLKASGHVDKFNDLMVEDVETSDAYRADHLLGEHLENLLQQHPQHEHKDEMQHLLATIDELDQKQMDVYLRKYEVTAPDTGNAVTKCYPFNLMFQTSIGPSATQPAYLRPETAQGIFVNFKRLLESVGGKLPFACAQIGLSFRNEIAPKGGLLRVREFQQAEIEHFVNPEDKSHAKFAQVRDVTINMFGREQQLHRPYKPVSITVGEAVEKGFIDNETLGYFIGRTSMFVEQVGMNMKFVRFRQHLEHEMAHYASDCWDLEIMSLSNNKWVECAGLADRSAYDLGNHSEKSGSELRARVNYAEPKRVEEVVCVANKGTLGRQFKRDAQGIIKQLSAMDEEEVKTLKQQLETGECKAQVSGFDIGPEHVSFRKESKMVSGKSLYPSVIEPSFGVGRILWCLWEHCYYVREGEDEADAQTVRRVLALPGCVAPVKCCVLPLSKNVVFESLLAEVRQKLSAAGLVNRVDDSGTSIGKRYARADEMGTPLGITVDFESVKDGSVTVRERDSTAQIRCASVADAVDVVRRLVAGETAWSDVLASYGNFRA